MARNIFEYLFSVRNDSDDIHKNIAIFGLKIKIKRWKYRKLKFTGKIQNWGCTIDGDSIAILGNGPSLRDTLNDVDDYKFITNREICVVNSFVCDEQFFIIKPKYYVLMDPDYWATNQSQNVIKKVNDMCENLSKVDWKLSFFMPKKYNENNIFKNLYKENKYIKFYYINTETAQIHNKYFLYNLYKENQASPIMQNVLVACIYIAINLGYKNIFIYGADHSWHLSLIVNGDNIPCIIDKHFYDKGELTYTPLYKNGTGEKEYMRLSEEFENFVRVHKQYEILEEYSQFMGATIYNLSKFSCIDAFRRKIPNNLDTIQRLNKQQFKGKSQ